MSAIRKLAGSPSLLPELEKEVILLSPSMREIRNYPFCLDAIPLTIVDLMPYELRDLAQMCVIVTFFRPFSPINLT